MNCSYSLLQVIATLAQEAAAAQTLETATVALEKNPAVVQTGNSSCSSVEARTGSSYCLNSGNSCIEIKGSCSSETRGECRSGSWTSAAWTCGSADRSVGNLSIGRCCSSIPTDSCIMSSLGSCRMRSWNADRARNWV